MTLFKLGDIVRLSEETGTESVGKRPKWAVGGDPAARRHSKYFDAYQAFTVIDVHPHNPTAPVTFFDGQHIEQSVTPIHMETLTRYVVRGVCGHTYEFRSLDLAAV